MTWLEDYSNLAAHTDTLVDRAEHQKLLAAGLAGEVGSVCAEIKKATRDEGTYPELRQRLTEELGDVLWYFCRLVSILSPGFLRGALDLLGSQETMDGDKLTLSLQLALRAGHVTDLVSGGDEISENDSRRANPSFVLETLQPFWITLNNVALSTGLELCGVATVNSQKRLRRWPIDREHHPLFDEEFPVIEQIPRKLRIEFMTLDRGTQKVVLLRCNGLNFGDRLTDNIRDPDGYRYHDIFHFGYAIHLGWSPVVRSLLRCKRKSRPVFDEAEDGARAAIIEEAISALVFSRAKSLNFFAGVAQLDYDLLKIIKELTTGYEVEAVSEWQWEQAILEGYRVFRELRKNASGVVTLDLVRRELTYAPLEIGEQTTLMG